MTITAAVACGLVAGALLLLAAAVAFLPFNARELMPREISTIVFDRAGRPLRSYLATDDRWRIPVRLPEISHWAVKAAIAVEDQRFRSHHGVDFRAVLRAMATNVRHGRIVSGASTITMQVASLCDTRERTLFRKLRQAFRALQLECHSTKDEILEMYLTAIPYGGNICGIEAASRRYFGKPAAELSLSEAALLAGLPQSPSRLRPDRNPAQALKRRAHVLSRMLEEGYITRADYDRVIGQKPLPGNHEPAFDAPHFCDLVHARHGGAPRLRSTLDRDTQRIAETLVRAKVRALAAAGVTNGAAVVIDNQSGGVLALVGSVDYASVANQGQVNGATSLRSPGSALKPLIYAYAFDKGNLLPSTVLYDVPSQYLEYEPENFDRTFHGLVPADKSLAWSLNVPAIQVLNETGLARTLRFMRSCGIETLKRPPNDYGLSLAIGSCGVRLLDLANAYAAVARGGVWRPYRVVLREDDVIRSAAAGRGAALDSFPRRSTVTGEVRVLSEAACYFVTRALADTHLRPPESVSLELTGLEGVAWKTGTSSGFRDAWTIAYDRGHTVGVWIGNFDGRASRSLVGVSAAAPVALDILRRVSGGRGRGAWPVRPPGIRRITVCTETGMPAAPDCPTTRTADAMPASVDREQYPWLPDLPPACTIHRRLMVDRATGQQLCARCAAGHAVDYRVCAVWPTSVAGWLAENGRAAEAPPPHNRECGRAPAGVPLRITSPRHGDMFAVTSLRSPEAQKLPLDAVTPDAGSRLFWFLDGELVAEVPAGTKAYVTPSKGRHALRCVDEWGRADWISFTVQGD